MAKAERKSNPFGWILLGALAGAIATAGVLLLASSMSFNRGYEEGPTEIRTAADDAAAAAARPTPVATAPKPETPPPLATVPAPAVEQPPVDAQMADDAAAAGMTSRAEQEHPTN
jgi:type IV secretory pathway VirB10-like protein